MNNTLVIGASSVTVDALSVAWLHINKLILFLVIKYSIKAVDHNDFVLVNLVFNRLSSLDISLGGVQNIVSSFSLGFG